MIPLLLGAAASALGAIQSGKQQKKANQLQQEGLDMAKADYTGRQGFRDAATSTLNRQINPDALTSIYADPGNPFAAGNKYVDPFMAKPAAPAAAPMSGASDLENAKNALRKSKLPVGQQERIMRAWDAGTASPTGAPAMPNTGGQAPPMALASQSHAEPDPDQMGGPSDGDADNGTSDQRAQLNAVAQMMAPGQMQAMRQRATRGIAGGRNMRGAL